MTTIVFDPTNAIPNHRAPEMDIRHSDLTLSRLLGEYAVVVTMENTLRGAHWYVVTYYGNFAAATRDFEAELEMVQEMAAKDPYAMALVDYHFNATMITL